MFSSLLLDVFTDAWQSLCRKHTCTVTVIHYYTDDRQLLIAHCSSHRPDSQIFVENRDFRLPPAFDAPVRWVPVEIDSIPIVFGIIMEKLEWCGYPTAKKSEDTFTSFDRIHEGDGRTDGHRVTAWPRLCRASRGNKMVRTITNISGINPPLWTLSQQYLCTHEV